MCKGGLAAAIQWNGTRRHAYNRDGNLGHTSRPTCLMGGSSDCISISECMNSFLVALCFNCLFVRPRRLSVNGRGVCVVWCVSVRLSVQCGVDRRACPDRNKHSRRPTVTQALKGSRGERPGEPRTVHEPTLAP